MDIPGVTRVAEALEALVRHAEANHQLTNAALTEQMKHNEETRQILMEDLTFRREQAQKADGEKEMFLKMMFGGAIPGGAPAVPPVDGAPGASAPEPMRRRRHS
jgi:hypothetical protein